jgi:tetratricopeptide (TPR) repeat protein
MPTIRDALTIATQHHRAGRQQDAEQAYRQILSVDPNNSDAIHLLGVIASQAGNHTLAFDYVRRAIALNDRVASYHNNLGVVCKELNMLDEAAACHCRAIALAPNSAEFQSNLGVVYKLQGKLDEAAACYRRAIALSPDNADFHSNLGVVHKVQGKLDEAVACYRRAIELKPSFADAHSNLGVALREQKKLDEAVASFGRALAINPAFPQAYNNLGNALKEQGKLDEAVACYHRALQLRTGYAEVYGNLGAALIDQGKLEEGAAACRRALDLKPDDVEAHVNLGSSLKEQGRPEEAIACYGRAVELRPQCAGAHYSLGLVWESVGDMAAAAAGYRAAVRHHAGMAIAHYKLATLLGGKLPEEELAAQGRLLEQANLTDEERMYVYFGLAYVLDDRGEYAEAARHSNRGNALQLAEWRRLGREYDPREHSLVIDRLVAACTPDFFRRAAGFGAPSELPVFIVGLPRSGTTLVEQILAAHSEVFGAGEIRLGVDTMNALTGQVADAAQAVARLDRETAERLAARHLERLRALAPAARRVVDKMPDNYMLLGPLACLFPRARFIHCRRDLRDVAVSCWMTHFKEVRWANDERHIAARFRDYARMMDHWRRALPAPLLEIDYEETVVDLEGVARRIVAWCGLEWQPACLEFQLAKRPVTTASAVQVRRPVYATSVGRWKHYEQHLATLLGAIPAARSCLLLDAADAEIVHGES